LAGSAGLIMQAQAHARCKQAQQARRLELEH
ncbi:hypothetical protein L195_g061665, partial [Trifolium pratense]